MTHPNKVFCYYISAPYFSSASKKLIVFNIHSWIVLQSNRQNCEHLKYFRIVLLCRPMTAKYQDMRAPFFTSASQKLIVLIFTAGLYYSQTDKTVNTWNISGLCYCVVQWQKNIRDMRTSHKTTNCCFRFSFLTPDWPFSLYNKTFQTYFWCSVTLIVIVTIQLVHGM